MEGDYKELTSLSTFKSEIKNWETDKCPCILCKTYIQRVGFICLAIVTSDQCLLNIILLLWLFVCLFLLFIIIIIIIIIIYCYYCYYLFIIIIIINWYKMDCEFFAELCKFFQFQIKY